MVYNKRKMLCHAALGILGLVLIIFYVTGIQRAELILPLGAALLCGSILRVSNYFRYRNDEKFREKTDIAVSDERNRYIRMKAWAVAGYIFILGAACIALVMFLTGRSETALVLEYSVCFLLLLYYLTYMILQKKE